jgi:hypothetical protein
MYHPSSELFVGSARLLVYQEQCIGHDTPSKTSAHFGVNTRITILKITFQGNLVIQGSVERDGTG